MALEPINYKLNADHGDPDHTLAALLEPGRLGYLPQLMMVKRTETKHVHLPRGVVPVLVKAIRKQQAQIEQLKHQLSARR